MGVEIKVNSVDILGLKLVLSEIKNGVERVLATSINAAIKTTQVQAVKLIGKDLNLTAKRIKEDFTQDKANFGRISGALIAAGEPVGLINFQAKKVKTGVSHKVKKAAARSTTRGAYISKGKSGNKEHVFRRNYSVTHAPIAVVPGRVYSALPDKFRLPTSRKTGPRIEDIYAKSSIYDAVSKIAADKFAENVSNKTKDLLRRYG